MQVLSTKTDFYKLKNKMKNGSGGTADQWGKID